MAVQKILVPYNFTHNDQKTLNFVMRNFLHQQDVDVTLFHAYTPPPKIEASQNTVTAKLSSNLRYLTQRIAEQENELKKVTQTLQERGFSENNLHYIYQARKKDTAGEIIDIVNKWKFQIVVLSHKPGRIARFFTGTVFTKVVTSLANTTVCIVS